MTLSSLQGESQVNVFHLLVEIGLLPSMFIKWEKSDLNQQSKPWLIFFCINNPIMYINKDLEICAYLQQKSWLLLWSLPHQVLYIIQYCCLLVQPLQGPFTTPCYSRSFDPLPWLHIWCHYCLVQPLDPYQFSITALFFIPSITLLLKLGCWGMSNALH